MTTIEAGKPDGYVSVPVSNQSDAMIATLQIVLSHTADVFQGVVDAVAEHYKLDKEEMMAVIRKHPKFMGVIQNPVLQDLGYLYQEKAAVEPAVKAKFIPKKKPVV